MPSSPALGSLQSDEACRGSRGIANSNNTSSATQFEHHWKCALSAARIPLLCCCPDSAHLYATRWTHAPLRATCHTSCTPAPMTAHCAPPKLRWAAVWAAVAPSGQLTHSPAVCPIRNTAPIVPAGLPPLQLRDRCTRVGADCILMRTCLGRHGGIGGLSRLTGASSGLCGKPFESHSLGRSLTAAAPRI